MAKVLVIGSLAESLINFRGDLLRHLVALRHDVHVAAPPGPAWVDERLAAWGVVRHELPLQRTGTGWSADLRLVATIRRLCLAERPQVLLGYTIKPVVYGAIAGRLAGVPRIAAMITGLGFTFMPVSRLRGRLVQQVARLLYRVALRCAHVALFQNPDDEAEFRRAGLLPAGLQVVRIHGSGINVARYSAQPLPEGPLSFLLIARLLADKGVREYLQAARAVRSARPDARCHLIGPFDSNPAAISHQEIDQAVAEGSVAYHGAVQDVRPALADCHVYVLPSYREGMPRSVLEALATGRPVITTDAPGCRETVEPGVNGLLVPVADAHALADAMLRMASLGRDDLQRMGAASRRLAEGTYNVELVNGDIVRALRLHAETTA
jgi:glycosyltransferase involved in cell wall biosynthesis